MPWVTIFDSLIAETGQWAVWRLPSNGHRDFPYGFHSADFETYFFSENRGIYLARFVHDYRRNRFTGRKPREFARRKNGTPPKPNRIQRRAPEKHRRCRRHHGVSDRRESRTGPGNRWNGKRPRLCGRMQRPCFCRLSTRPRSGQAPAFLDSQNIRYSQTLTFPGVNKVIRMRG